MKNRFQKQTKIKSKIAFLLPIVICLIMAAVLWGSSSRIFSETQKRQEESTKNAVLKGAVQCYAVEGRYPESLSYLEQHYGVSYDKDKFIVGTIDNDLNTVVTIRIDDKFITLNIAKNRSLNSDSALNEYSLDKNGEIGRASCRERVSAEV